MDAVVGVLSVCGCLNVSVCVSVRGCGFGDPHWYVRVWYNCFKLLV